MASVISFIIIIVVSLLVNKIATKALVLSGLSWQSAQFQARSAFTGVGFTTSEAEHIVNHPVRRKIVLLLMLLGNAGLVTAISSLVLTFAGGRDQLNYLISIGIIIGGLLLIWLISKSRYLDLLLERFIDLALKKFTDLNVVDYQRLLDLRGNYEVTELKVNEEDWLAGKSLQECSLREEGVIVLSIRREDGRFVGAPHGKNKIHVGDMLTLYGRRATLKELDNRAKGLLGDQAHGEASKEQEKVKEKEGRQEDSLSEG